MDHPVLKEAVVATPPVGYMTAYLAGIDLPTFINYCMAIYAIGLAVKTLWAGYKRGREWWDDRYYRSARRKITRSNRHRGATTTRALGVVSLLAALAIGVASAFIGPKEGRSYVAYRDFGNATWTICDGHTGGVKQGDVATDAQCDEWRRQDLEAANTIVDACIHFPLTVSQRAAFISAAFNIGPRVMCGSTLQAKANAGDMAGACSELVRWDMAGGKHWRGLAKRRADERALCMKIDFTNVLAQ